jgi:Zn-dependent protease with chaperone function
MNVALILPLAIVAVALGASWFTPRIARPSAAVWALTISMVLTVAAIATLLVQLAAAGLSEVPIVADLIGWCPAIYAGQHGATPIVSFAAFAILLFIVSRIVGFSRAVRADIRNFEGVSGVQIVDVERPIAFAVPGNPGGVIMSRTLLAELGRDERVVVLAHENAHLRFHHHVFVNLTRACAAGVPLLAPIARQVSFLTERWADEFAAEGVGSRRLVADTIARVALLPGMLTPSHAQGLAGVDVLSRFEALESPASMPAHHSASLVIATSAMAALGVVLQTVHLVNFLVHSQ